MTTITFQLQLEPDSYVDPKGMAILHKRMVDFALSIESFGYLRYQMYFNNKAYTPE